MADPPTSPSPKSPTDFPNASVSSPAPEPSVGIGSTVIGTAPDVDHPPPPKIGLGINDTSSKPEHPSPVGMLFNNDAIKPDTDISWAPPAGLHIPRPNHENLVIFRRAVGINSTMAGSTDPKSLEEGRRKAVGIYAIALGEVRRKKFMYHLLSAMINTSHVMQIVIGASLTALGPTAGDHVLAITLLGAANTVIAGVLALVKGQGLPDRLYHDRAEYRRLQDWIEQAEALLSVGVIGRDRKEVGFLVQTAFKKYNAAKQCEESNLPENYVRPPESNQPGKTVSVSQGSQGSQSSPTPQSPPIHNARSGSSFP